MRNFAIALVIASASFLAFGCSDSSDDDDSSSGTSKTELADSVWYGTILDRVAPPAVEISITFDANGDIADVLIDGVSVGGGTVASEEEDDIFSFEMDNGTNGGFVYFDHHAALLTEDLEIGAVQKDATALAGSYAVSDLEGSWEGLSIDVDADFNLTIVQSVEVTVASDGSYEGSTEDGVTFSENSSNIADLNGMVGHFYGGYENSEGVDTSIDVIVDPSMHFFATIACEDELSPTLDTCFYGAVANTAAND